MSMARKGWTKTPAEWREGRFREYEPPPINKSWVDADMNNWMDYIKRREEEENALD